MAEIYREIIRPSESSAMHPFQRNKWSMYEIIPFKGISNDLLEAQDSETLDGFPEIHFSI
jgi:hypothetical protein